MKYIDADKLIAEIKHRIKLNKKMLEMDSRPSDFGRIQEGRYILRFIERIQQEQPEVDFEKLKNKAELIANGIMMGVQANKYHTCIYDKASNDFNHSHLLRAALKGIELGLNARRKNSSY